MVTAFISFVMCLFVLLLCLFWFIRNPVLTKKSGARLAVHVSEIELKRHVYFLSSISPSRNSKNLTSLNIAADYINHEFLKTGGRIEIQKFQISGQEYKNIICSFGPPDAERLIIGAHYDVHFENNPGADDNASGIAAVLEIARLLSLHHPDLKHRIDLIAYTLEERPHFKERVMGSYIHAESLFAERVKIKLMISAEMIGYYSDAPGSQKFPFMALKWFYPDKGNFIGVVGRAFDRKLVRRAKILMSVYDQMPVYSINAPSFVPGIDLSDHRNYWHFSYPALMVTDTAFMRNPYYHTAYDTPDRLDYTRMAWVVSGLYQVAVSY